MKPNSTTAQRAAETNQSQDGIACILFLSNGIQPLQVPFDCRSPKTWIMDHRILTISAYIGMVFHSGSRRTSEVLVNRNTYAS
jgi:hypothetical protein